MFSIKKISAHFSDSTGVWGELIQRALKLHEAGYSTVEDVLRNVNAIIGAHGVEALSAPHDDGTPNPIAYYVNTGDTYSATLLWDVRKKRFELTTWGDWYERSPEYRAYAKAQRGQQC